jgi:putative ABC transport system permease protein
LFALGLCVVTALAVGLVSTLTLRSGNSSSALGAPTRSSLSAAARRMTSLLVIVEIALAIVLLVGAGLILQSFSRLLSVDPGFRADKVMTMQIKVPADRYASSDALQSFYRRAFTALRENGEVKDVGAAVVIPLTGNNWTTSFERPEQPVPEGERPPEVGWQLASAGYFRALQIPLIAGRLFNDGDVPKGKPVVIISEAIQKRFFPNENPIGKEVKQGNGRMEIVGVVGNIRRSDLRDEPRADLYFPFESSPSSQTVLFVRASSDPTRAFASVKDVLRSIEPGTVFLETRTLASIASESTGQTQLALWLLGIFAATALVLAAIGVYGVMSYGVRQRTREIGTRVALGATGGNIIWLVMRQGAAIAAIGVIIGLATGLIASRALVTMLYGISSSDPMTLGLACIVLFATTMAASYIPARRAMKIDPMKALRYE